MKHTIRMSISIVSLLFLSSQLNGATIVLLRGWFGKCGKVEICNEIQYKNRNWVVVDEDEYFYHHEPLHWTQLFPKEMKAITSVVEGPNILHAVKRNQIVFKNDSSPDKREKAFKAMNTIRIYLSSTDESINQMRREWNASMRERLLNAINAYANTGYNVVVNTWFLDIKEYDRFKNDHRVVVGMVYCPFDTMVKRIIAQNHESMISGNLLAVRFLDQGLMHFKHLYETQPAIQQFAASSAIDTLSLATFNATCDLIELSLVESTHTIGASKKFVRGEMSRELLSAYKQSFLEQFALSKTVNIVAKDRYDLLLNAAILSPAECAQHILAHI